MFRLARRLRFARFGWGLADQSLSSLTNFVTAALVARTAGVEEFGVFAVAFATYTLGLGVSRATTGEPLVTRFSALAEEEWKEGVRASAGAALLLGLVFGIVSVMVALMILQGSFRFTFAALGFTFPGLILQDAWRHAFFASTNSRRALINDLAWTVLLAFGLMFVLAGRQHSAAPFMLVWGLSATGAAVAGALQAHLVPRPRQALVWLRRQSDLGGRFLAEFLALTGATQLMLFALALTSGVASVGALRAGMVAMGPFNILLMGVALVAVPEAVRVAHEPQGDLRKYCLTLSVLLAGAAVAWGFIMLIVPDRVGTFVLGETWEAARPTVLPLSLWVAGNGLVAGAVAGLRALQAAARSLRAQVVSASVRLLLGVLGGLLTGATGAAWGVAVATLGTSAIWWRHLLGALRDRQALDLSSSEGVVYSRAVPREG